MANEEPVTFGPYGGSGGEKWDDGIYSTVTELVIYSGDIINSIQIVYDTIEGKPVSKTRRGGDGGFPNSVKFEYPAEYLVSISGCHGSGSPIVNSLTFHSNIKQYGPYGKEEGIRFESRLAAGKIVGFFGNKGNVLDSIGVYIKPIQTAIPVGPFGTTGGQQWDDKTYSTIRELIIYSGWVIDSIQVVYEDFEGNSVSGQKHGGDGGQLSTVTLEYPDEFLVSIWGYYGQIGSKVAIRSLGFQSNKKTYGPFGVEDGEKFEIASNGGKIIGFHGRSRECLTAIGAYLDK
ncbi:agglutinin-like [Cornus florida]|uniref:agglutinin-like n=1 Tax=Cornus florida TaxID=4283 RepID=UPI00289BD48B|nr:agglutinin-like [Cornus florida]